MSKEAKHTPTPFEQAYGHAYFPCHICLVEAAPYHIYERDEVCLIRGQITCTNCAQDSYPEEATVEIPSPNQVLVSSQAEIARLREALKLVISAIGEWSRPTGANGMVAASESHPLVVAKRNARIALSEGK